MAELCTMREDYGKYLKIMASMLDNISLPESVKTHATFARNEYVRCAGPEDFYAEIDEVSRALEAMEIDSDEEAMEM